MVKTVEQPPNKEQLHPLVSLKKSYLRIEVIEGYEMATDEGKQEYIFTVSGSKELKDVK